ncbi:probable E3 ubiquitin-protein ligase RHA1A [Lolium perenne]|uniref:probable E3 ubiquitin-protein ligase RHA1A n=1 Tax=Lolium perenne TaxID=4522 RepID=UPI0021F52B72|nr:probable E3 ubiquitin-protein ligase RHA1A [Lolium perenne]
MLLLISGSNTTLREPQDTAENHPMPSLLATILHLLSFVVDAVRRLLRLACSAPSFPSEQERPEVAAACSTELRDRELPVARYGEQRGAEHERCCVFCLSGIEDDDEVRVLRCLHLFHRCCLDRWLAARPAATCPLCRGKLLTVTAAKYFPGGEQEERRSIEGMCMVMLMACVHRRSSAPAV